MFFFFTYKHRLVSRRCTVCYMGYTGFICKANCNDLWLEARTSLTCSHEGAAGTQHNPSFQAVPACHCTDEHIDKVSCISMSWLPSSVSQRGPQEPTTIRWTDNHKVKMKKLIVEWLKFILECDTWQGKVTKKSPEEKDFEPTGRDLIMK